MKYSGTEAQQFAEKKQHSRTDQATAIAYLAATAATAIKVVMRKMEMMMRHI